MRSETAYKIGQPRLGIYGRATGLPGIRAVWDSSLDPSTSRTDSAPTAASVCRASAPGRRALFGQPRRVRQAQVNDREEHPVLVHTLDQTRLAPFRQIVRKPGPAVGFSVDKKTRVVGKEALHVDHLQGKPRSQVEQPAIYRVLTQYSIDLSGSAT